MIELLSAVISAAVGVGAFAGMTRARLRSIDASLNRIDGHLARQNGTLGSHACKIAVLEDRLLGARTPLTQNPQTTDPENH